jgi:inorganic pyrophosphatase
MNTRSDFWAKLDEMVAGHELVIDRPRDSAHPRHRGWTYPLDYGYLAGTRSGDGEGIDVWLGSRPEMGVNGAVCTVDLEQGDTELKLLLGCTSAEMQTILAVHNRGDQAAILVARQADEGTEG